MLIGSNFGLVATVNQKIVVKAAYWFYVLQVQPVAPDFHFICYHLHDSDFEVLHILR